MERTGRFGELTGFESVPPGATRPSVLFVHGWWGGAWVWDRFMERFAAAGFPCFAINLRGYHDSKPVADIGKVTCADHVEDIRAALTRLDEPLLVTHSASGLFALKLAETITLRAAVHLVPSPPAGFFSFRTTRVMAPYLPRMLRGKPIILNRRDMIAADLNRLPPAEQEEVYARMVPAPGVQGREMLTLRVDPKRVSGARLIISGGDDRLIPARIHRKMAKRYGSDYLEYPEHAHYIMREPGWEAVANDVIGWLERVAPSAQRAVG